MRRILTAVASPVFAAGFAPALAVWALTAIGTVIFYS
jgi:hypothetical protein